MRLSEVLFPTDFSTASDVAGGIAREMARQAGARLHILHVVPPVTDPSLPAEQIARLAQTMGEGLPVETALLTGRAGRHIVAYARDKHIDLIVMATHGRTGISHAILGSVAETVARLAPCLVLTVPAALISGSTGSPVAPLTAIAGDAACAVCGGNSEEPICEPCRTRVRAEALDRKREAERPGRRDMPV